MNLLSPIWRAKFSFYTIIYLLLLFWIIFLLYTSWLIWTSNTEYSAFNILSTIFSFLFLLITLFIILFKRIKYLNNKPLIILYLIHFLLAWIAISNDFWVLTMIILFLFNPFFPIIYILYLAFKKSDWNTLQWNINNEDEKKEKSYKMVLSLAEILLERSNKFYNWNEEELTNILYKEFEVNLHKASMEQIKEDFVNIDNILDINYSPDIKKMEIWIYSILSSIIINSLMYWNIHSPLWKFEYYKFLLFYFLIKLVELWYYKNKDEMLEVLRNIDIDFWWWNVSLINEREDFLDEYGYWDDFNEENINIFNTNNINNKPIKDILPQEEYEDFQESITKAEENINEMLKLDEEKKDILLKDMLNKVLNKEYDVIIDLDNGQHLQKYLVETNNTKDLAEYYLLVWASYQEVWNLDLANMCFDIFLNNISLDNNIIQTFEKEGIDKISAIKMMILIKRLQDLGLSYKMNSKEYDKTSKSNNIKSKTNNIKKKK